VPPLPAGIGYVEVVANEVNTLLRRSDGVVLGVGYAGSGLNNIPALPAGLVYTRLSVGRYHAAGIRSDGTIQVWGPPAAYPWLVPALPFGVSYVEIASGYEHVVARRSDGEVVVFGQNTPLHLVPLLEPGTSYHRIGAGYRNCVGIVGPSSTYVSFAAGCAGSMPACRLTPRDTPRIGDTLAVQLRPLPANLALMVSGWQRVTPPLSLAFLGMPGCTADVTLDVATLLVGTGGNALFELPIPYQTSLIGVRFFNQAFVFDPAAGNPMGAVVSDATEAVIGG
jgi:hypothetical protein